MPKSDQQTMINGSKVVDKHITGEVLKAIEALMNTEINEDSKPFLTTAIKVIVTLAILTAREELVMEQLKGDKT